MFKSDERNRGEWPLGTLEHFFEGKNEVEKAAKLRVEKTLMAQPVQHLYLLE